MLKTDKIFEYCTKSFFSRKLRPTRRPTRVYVNKPCNSIHVKSEVLKSVSRILVFRKPHPRRH